MINLLKKNYFSKKQAEIKNVKAFTLVETLTAMFIISTIVLGPLTVAMNAAAYARQTKDVMIATYLAQESTELIHHLQDTLYLKCVGDVSGVSCPASDPNGDGVFDEPGESSWLLLKNYLTSGNSCFSSDGCAYDFIDMTIDGNTAPTKYSLNSGLCNTLSLTSNYLYVCSGAHGGIGDTNTSFSRIVKVDNIDVPTGGDSAYNDGLRVTATVSFRRSNGYIRTVKLVDFLHAHK
ncbi:MAG: type II secretion system protein [Candidatus Nomurabacteria bacterium]